MHMQNPTRHYRTVVILHAFKKEYRQTDTLLAKIIVQSIVSYIIAWLDECIRYSTITYHFHQKYEAQLVSVIFSIGI